MDSGSWGSRYCNLDCVGLSVVARVGDSSLVLEPFTLMIGSSGNATNVGNCRATGLLLQHPWLQYLMHHVSFHRLVSRSPLFQLRPPSGHLKVVALSGKTKHGDQRLEIDGGQSSRAQRAYLRENRGTILFTLPHLPNHPKKPQIPETKHASLGSFVVPPFLLLWGRQAYLRIGTTNSPMRSPGQRRKRNPACLAAKHPEIGNES
ncbi:hypothetical protein MUK42_13407 [Musa troglodytarum]|uniref:Uncharacterized protein n=1 Tax=Musa troglodytarum TaxID=320322 RepID=A0A9E7HUT1_9LILI|nr:hypothetical protein MUK42_13407 [Musa troglodytarum]